MYVKHSHGHIKLQWDLWQWSCWFLNQADTQQDTQEIVWQAEAQIHTRHWLCRDHCKRQDTCASAVDSASHKQHTRHTPNQANINQSPQATKRVVQALWITFWIMDGHLQQLTGIHGIYCKEPRQINSLVKPPVVRKMTQVYTFLVNWQQFMLFSLLKITYNYSHIQNTHSNTHNI